MNKAIVSLTVLIFLFLFCPSFLWAASICYDEQHYPSVIKLKSSDTGLEVHLADKYVSVEHVYSEFSALKKLTGKGIVLILIESMDDFRGNDSVLEIFEEVLEETTGSYCRSNANKIELLPPFGQAKISSVQAREEQSSLLVSGSSA